MDRLIVYRDESGLYRWKKVAPNGRTIASSGESFDSRSNAVRAAKDANPEADLLKTGEAGRDFTEGEE